MPKATGTITVKSYEPISYDKPADGPELVEIHVSETFSGDIAGDGTVRFLQSVRPDGSAAFCGIERIQGTVGGKRGTFLLQDSGSLSGNVVSGTWFVIPNSGTGELAGLRGEGGFKADLGQGADWWLNYELQ